MTDEDKHLQEFGRKEAPFVYLAKVLTRDRAFGGGRCCVKLETVQIKIVHTILFVSEIYTLKNNRFSTSVIAKKKVHIIGNLQPMA